MTMREAFNDDDRRSLVGLLDGVAPESGGVREKLVREGLAAQLRGGEWLLTSAGHAAALFSRGRVGNAAGRRGPPRPAGCRGGRT